MLRQLLTLRSNGAVLEPLRRLLRNVRGLFALLVVAAILAGFGQALVLGVVVQIALTLTESSLAGSSLGVLGRLPEEPSTLIALGAAAIVVVFALEIATAYLQARLGSRVLHGVRIRLYDAYSNATVEAQNQLGDGELAQTIAVNGAWAGTATLSASIAAVGLGNFAALAITAAVISPGATAVMTVAVGFVLIAVRPVAGRSRGASTDMAERNNQLAATATLAADLGEEIRTLGVEEPYRARVHDDIGALTTYWNRIRFLARLGPALFRNAALMVVFAAISAVYLLEVGALAALGTTMLLLIRSLTYLQSFQGSLQDLHSNIPWLEGIWTTTDMLCANPRATSGDRTAEPAAIRFSQVGLTYPNGTTALAGVELEIGSGEIVGIVGPSAAGKSSLARILLRERSPTEGVVTLDGHVLTDFDDEAWAAHVAFVPQEPRLIPGTVAENIAFMRELPADAVATAARAARIHDEIVALPEGYATPLETGDTRLSGGQKQRLVLARALAGAPGIVVLDEPTSALDLPSEARITETIADLRGKTTVVIIAHRLSSLTACDRIVVVEGGRVTADGTPTAVAETNPFYRQAQRLSAAGAN